MRETMHGVSHISRQSLALWCAGLLLIGCGSNSDDASHLKGLGSGGTMSATGGTGTGASGGTGGTRISIGDPNMDAGSGGDAGGPGGDSCGDVTCELGERCVEDAGAGSCVENECSDL